jgi:DNA-binding response OmpR family regulator
MSKLILLVDRDPAAVGAINDMFEIMGHRVQTETSGGDALSAFERNPGAFDLIITELGIPDISGFLLVQRFLKIRSDIPVILLTSQEGQAQSIARESGIRWYAVKPLSIMELRGMVESAMNGSAH